MRTAKLIGLWLGLLVIAGGEIVWFSDLHASAAKGPLTISSYDPPVFIDAGFFSFSAASRRVSMVFSTGDVSNRDSWWNCNPPDVWKTDQLYYCDLFDKDRLADGGCPVRNMGYCAVGR